MERDVPFELEAFSSGGRDQSVVATIRQTTDSIVLRYFYQGSSPLIFSPASKASTIYYNLWQNSCFEFFIRHPDNGSYLEWNFANEQRWCAFAFSGYRKAVEIPTLLMKPEWLQWHEEGGRLELAVMIPWTPIHLFFGGIEPLYASPTAITQSIQGIEYWAPFHGKEKPDFHRGEAMIYEMGCGLSLEHQDQSDHKGQKDQQADRLDDIGRSFF